MALASSSAPPPDRRTCVDAGAPAPVEVRGTVKRLSGGDPVVRTSFDGRIRAARHRLLVHGPELRRRGATPRRGTSSASRSSSSPVRRVAGHAAGGSVSPGAAGRTSCGARSRARRRQERSSRSCATCARWSEPSRARARGRAGAGPWSPERLRATLTPAPAGRARRRILANREPYIHEQTAEGAIRCLHPASGLVTALEPVMRACSGVWVAHGSGTADRETVDAKDHVRVPPGEESYSVRRVWLTRGRGERATTTASPTKASGRSATSRTRGRSSAPRTGSTTSRVNQKLRRRRLRGGRLGRPDRAGAGLPLRARAEDDPRAPAARDDHHLLAHPLAERGALRHLPVARRAARRPARLEHPRLPHPAALQQLHRLGRRVHGEPHRPRDARGRAGTGDARSCARTPSRSSGRCTGWQGMRTGRRSAASSRAARARARAATRCSASASTASTTPRGSRSGCWPSTSCSTRYPEFRGRFTFAQLAAPSRTKIDRYRELNERVEALAAAHQRAGGQRAATGRSCSCARTTSRPTVFRYYRAADLCYVSSLHDGMNLVAKEFVAARDDERGVLVLSQFTGAARDLTEALIVNPYDLRQASDALATALRMPAERAARADAVDAPPRLGVQRVPLGRAHARRRRRAPSPRADVRSAVARSQPFRLGRAA